MEKLAAWKMLNHEFQWREKFTPPKKGGRRIGLNGIPNSRLWRENKHKNSPEGTIIFISRLLLIRYLIASLIESPSRVLSWVKCFVFHSRSLKIIKIN